MIAGKTKPIPRTRRLQIRLYPFEYIENVGVENMRMEIVLTLRADQWDANGTGLSMIHRVFISCVLKKMFPVRKFGAYRIIPPEPRRSCHR